LLERLKSEETRRALRVLWETLESRQQAIDAAVEQEAREVPQFLALLQTLPRSVREAEAVRSRALQRAALVDGDWAPYLADLRLQGETYAKMGIPFPAWFRLVGAFRSVVADAVASRPDASREVSRAIEPFLDLAMATIGEAYLSTKEEMIRATRQELDHYIQLAESSPIAMAVWRWADPGDPSSFDLVTANPAAKDLAPDELAAAKGGRLSQLPRWSKESEIPRLMVEALTERRPRSWSATRRTADGRRICYQGQCFPLRANYVAVMFEDVSERVAMREELQRQLQELERSNRELDDFAYIASHDLRAPLQDIRTLAQWVGEDAGDALPLEAALHLDRLAGRVRRMERLLEDLLDYSRVGRGSALTTELTLAELVSDIVALLRPASGFVVTTRRSPRFTLPRPAIERVLANLILNAIKHHDRHEGSVVVDGEVRSGRLIVEVTDDGPGIPEAYHERVFRIFQTLKPRDEVEASGVGLAIVKKTVEGSGGSVGIRSSGRGTTVHLEWPLTAAVSEVRHASGAEASA
jgi:signal transduction histidine kinase